MQAIHKLIPLLLMATSAHVAAQGSTELSYTAETYGLASGDLPMRGLGLVLELVDGASDAPKLRLFGGPAGHPASISISADSDSARTPQGAKRLIGESNTVHEGSFDWMGYYEVPLEGPLIEGAQFFAQGTHVGIFDLAGVGQALTQNSNGLQVHIVAPTETPISVGEFRPHLPQELAELPGTAGLAERLQRCLNSNGDSTKISLYVEGNGGAGANVGGQGSMEILVQRTSEGTYEVILAADLAVKAGVEIAEGLEANLSNGLGYQRIFAFHSAPGAARGIMGLYMATRYPNLTPSRWAADSGLLGSAEERVAVIQNGVELAGQGVQSMERLLRDVLVVSESKAATRKAAALKSVQVARRQHAKARRRARWTWKLRLIQRRIRYSFASANLVVCRALRIQGEHMLNKASQKFEQQRESMRAILAEIARLPRIASALSQTTAYTTDHFSGTEVHQKGTGSLDLGIPIPVSLATLGAGISAEAQLTYSVRFYKPTFDGSQTIVVTRDFQLLGTGSATLFVGGEYTYTRIVRVVNTIQVDTDLNAHLTTSRTLTRDVQVRGWVGDEYTALAATGVGIGRERVLSLDREMSISEDFDVVRFLQGEGRDLLGESEIGLAVQDRRIETFECDFILSVAGNGGGFEFDIEWTDKGRQFSRVQTIRDAVENLMDGLDQIPDQLLDTVTEL